MIINLPQIAKGIYNNILKKEEELYIQRITICKSCKLFKNDKLFGEICNPSLYLNPITNEISKVEKEGFKEGCSCLLKNKCRVSDAECPNGKW